MAQIAPAGSINLAALSADDLYIQIVNPPSYIRGVATDVFGCVGTASWGKVNTPYHMGSGQDSALAFGGISTASLTDPYDLATDLAIAFGQSSSGAAIEGWAVRVSDGTDTAASVSLAGVASTAETATITGTVAIGDVLKLTLTSSALTGSPISVTYTTTAATLANAAAGLAAAINANAVLAANYITATSAAGVVTITTPASLSPAVTYSSTVTTGSETITLASATGVTAGITLTGICTGILGNSISATVSTGYASNTYNVSITPFAGVTEVYPNIPAAGFWTALQNAINTGISSVRGPSNFVIASNAVPAVGAPTTGSFSLSGGTDGRAGVTIATLLGSDTATPRTGLYALRQLQPAVGIVWIVGSTSTTLVPSLIAFNQSEGCSSFLPFPTGTSTTTAVAAVSTNGYHDTSFAYAKDWIYFYDPINNVVRLVSPVPFIAGTTVSLSPQNSPGNKPVSLVIGTERNSPTTGTQAYTPSEIGQLENAGIMLITNPIPAGSQFGIRHGQTTSLSPATAPFEYWRMTMFLARSFQSTLGAFVGQLQSQQVDDPLRQSVRMQLNNFLTQLQGLGMIDGYIVSCQFSASPSAKPGYGMNTPVSVGQHYLYALVQVTYLSSVRFFVLSLQGGTTVVTIGTQTGNQSA